jgi:hypothetical protein
MAAGLLVGIEATGTLSSTTDRITDSPIWLVTRKVRVVLPGLGLREYLTGWIFFGKTPGAGSSSPAFLTSFAYRIHRNLYPGYISGIFVKSDFETVRNA